MPKHNITNEEKKQLFQRRLNGEAVSVIATDIGVPKSTVYAWLAEARKLRHESAKNQDGSITVEAMDYYQLKAHAKKLDGMLEVIKLVSDISEIPLDKSCIDTDTALNEDSERRLTNILSFIIRKGHMHQYATRRPKRKRRNTLEQQQLLKIRKLDIGVRIAQFSVF